MGIAARREHREAREAIGGDGSACGDASGSEILDGGSCEIGYDLHPDSTGGPPPPFYSNQNQRGVAPSELATAPQSCLDSAHSRLVHVDLAAKRVPRRVHYRATELVRERCLRIVEHNPDRHRDLIAAGGTLPATAARQAVRGRLPAPRNRKPSGQRHAVRCSAQASSLANCCWNCRRLLGKPGLGISRHYPLRSAETSG